MFVRVRGVSMYVPQIVPQNLPARPEARHALECARTAAARYGQNISIVFIPVHFAMARY